MLFTIFCPTFRPFTMNLSKGNGPGGEHYAKYERAYACPVANCKFCCFQQIELFRNGQNQGTVKEGCWFCVPNFRVLKADGTHQFDIHRPTCFGGMCVDIFAEGCCSCRIPFYIYVPGASGEVGSEAGKIVKVWGGLLKEAFTEADTFELIYPKDIDPETKLRILGGVFLLNQLYFEGSQNKNQDTSVVGLALG